MRSRRVTRCLVVFVQMPPGDSFHHFAGGLGSQRVSTFHVWHANARFIDNRAAPCFRATSFVRCTPFSCWLIFHLLPCCLHCVGPQPPQGGPHQAQPPAIAGGPIAGGQSAQQGQGRQVAHPQQQHPQHPQQNLPQRGGQQIDKERIFALVLELGSSEQREAALLHLRYCVAVLAFVCPFWFARSPLCNARDCVIVIGGLHKEMCFSDDGHSTPLTFLCVCCVCVCWCCVSPWLPPNTAKTAIALPILPQSSGIRLAQCQHC